ncbi:MAG: VanZ family protein [Flammeovirgaceae bacterium]|nr:VanZ family protein [Flammeovirgaceae bacterium]
MVGACAGIADELYQHLTPGRFPDVWDWSLDFSGIAISIPFFFWTRKLFSF